jgi:hypothetical protein
VEQEIRSCAAPDGVRRAWAKHGKGPVWRHWLEGLGERHTLVRYDERESGLSDRETKELSLERWVTDLETVVDAAGLDRFTLLGISQGAASAIAYAVFNVTRVLFPWLAVPRRGTAGWVIGGVPSDQRVMPARATVALKRPDASRWELV